ncbi:hypothetical protein Bca101_017161 [Brassica carinata]
MAAMSIQGSMFRPGGGYMSTSSDKLLKPASFAVKVFGNEAKAMVARGDLGAELPIEEVLILQVQLMKKGEEIAILQSGSQPIRRSQSTQRRLNIAPGRCVFVYL